MDFDKPKVYGDTSITDGLVFDGSPIQPPDKLLYAGYGLIMGLFEQEPRLLEVALEHYPNE